MKKAVAALLTIFLLAAAPAASLQAYAGGTILYGDVNGDGYINKKDALALKKYLADKAYGIDPAAADVYYDGEINKKDSLLLKQYLAGWEVTPGPEKPPHECIAPENYRSFWPDEKVVAFTFDDGPGIGTESVLDTVKESGDKVTFFIVGEMLDSNPSKNEALVRRALAEGCEIGSHTYHHTFLYKSSTGSIDEDVIREEFDTLEARYNSFTGEHLCMMRPPGGNFDKNKDYGYPSILWTVDSEDWRVYGKYRTELDSADAAVRAAAEDAAVSEIAANVLSQIRSGDIVLLHDIYRTSALAFKRLYAELKEQGYRFVTVSELLKIDPSEFHGWYFYASYSCGVNGSLDIAARSAEVFALPPGKFNM